MLGAVFVLGLLFWARLIVVADMPRTAIAEPDGVPPAGGRFSPAEGLPLSMPGLHRGTTTRPVEAEIPAASPNPGQDAQNDAIRLPN